MLKNETKEMLLGYKTNLLAFHKDTNREGVEIILFESPLLYDSTFPIETLPFNHQIEDEKSLISLISSLGGFINSGLNPYAYTVKRSERTDFEWLKLTVELTREFSQLKEFIQKETHDLLLKTSLEQLQSKQDVIVFNDVIYTLYSEQSLTESQAVSLMARTEYLYDETNKNSYENMTAALLEGSKDFTPKELDEYILNSPKYFNSDSLVITSLKDICAESNLLKRQ